MAKDKYAKFSQGNKYIGYIFAVEPRYQGFPYATFSTKNGGIKELRKAGYKIVKDFPFNKKIKKF